MSRKSVHPGHAPTGILRGLDEQFFAAYYEHVAPEDLQGYSPENLEQRARRHAELADTHRAGTAAVESSTKAMPASCWWLPTPYRTCSIRSLRS